MADSKKPKAHIADYKKDAVKKIVQLIKKYPIIGSINMENLPASQLQNMRGQLRGKVDILMTKRRIIKFAIEAAKGEKKGLEKIEEYLVGMPALLFTEENPFSLFKTLKKNKSKAPAKAGQTAPSDIIVPKGPTSFVPGPVIGELGALGIKSKVEGGKIAIQEDAVVCKEGEEISGPLAAMLTRLNILPMEVGLNIVAVYENGNIFTKDILDIDEEKFIEDMMKTAKAAFNLSLESGFITETTKEAMIQKAYKDSKAVAIEANFMADAVVGDLLAKAERQANALKGSIPELPEGAKEEKPAPKAEEKPAAEKKPAEEAKPEPEAPKAEKKKEEPKAEAPAPEKPAKPAKPDVTTVDDEMKEKVANMVNKTKQHAEGTEPSAEKLVEEANAEESKADEKPAEEATEEKKNMGDVEDLTKELLKKGTLRK
jgi:large subunit ribosomal protein L10